MLRTLLTNNQTSFATFTVNAYHRYIQLKKKKKKPSGCTVQRSAAFKSTTLIHQFVELPQSNHAFSAIFSACCFIVRNIQIHSEQLTLHDEALSTKIYHYAMFPHFYQLKYCFVRYAGIEANNSIFNFY